MADSRLNNRNHTQDAETFDQSRKTLSSREEYPYVKDPNSSLTKSIINYKPSKAFLDKCAIEQQTLLDNIEFQYHHQLRSLYQNECNADIIVRIGENFSKSLHRCILASRVFRFYNTLKLFEESELPVHQKIKTENSDINNKKVYFVPIELISPDLFKNFARRIYLDVDVHEEELKLTTKFGDWLKINKPHLLKTIYIPNRYSPNHKITFRTMIPDYDVNESSSSNTRIVMSTETDSIESSTNSNNNRIDSLDQISNPDLMNDSHEEPPQEATSNNSKHHFDLEPSTSSLPRTDTFERLIPTSKLDKTDVSAQPNSIEETNTYVNSENTVSKDLNHSLDINAHLNSSQDDDKSDHEANISKGGASNIPSQTSDALLSLSATPSEMTKEIITKTNGLVQAPQIVPKQRTSTIASAASRQSLSQSNDVPSKSKTTSNATSTGTLANKSSTVKGQDYQPVAQKRSNSINNKVSATTTRHISSNIKPINPIVSRAKPISMERAQSPILVGKQSRHQFKSGNSHTRQIADRKATNTPQQQTDNESETLGSEISDSGSYFNECPSGTGGYVSVDRHTLTSYSRLAEAMTRMFLDEIESDVIINVGGSKQIKAHKCILATRSAYLAEAIEKQHNMQVENNYQTPNSSSNKGTSENEEDLHATVNLNVTAQDNKEVYINLTDFSYATVHFAVLHLYSGIVKVSDDLALEDLAKLTHLLHVGTLRQVCQHNLRMTYCHFFHKPCNVCTLGVLKTLPLAWRYDYSDLYTKCLQWIGTYFAQIFCLKEFSELRPTDLIEECYTATLNQLQPDNIIQRTLECQKLLKNLPRVKWTETIVGLVGRQLEDFCHYVADNYDKIIQTDSFMSLGKNCWECEILEENLLAAMNHLKPDMGCKCLVLLHKIECSNETFNNDSASNFSESFANLVCKMRKYCERYLIREAAQVVHCPSWKQMNLSLQRKIKDQALITVDFDDPTRHLSTKPKLSSSMTRRVNPSSQISTIDDGNKTPSSVSKPSSGPSTQLPPMKNKKIVSRHLKVIK